MRTDFVIINYDKWPNFEREAAKCGQEFLFIEADDDEIHVISDLEKAEIIRRKICRAQTGTAG